MTNANNMDRVCAFIERLNDLDPDMKNIALHLTFIEYLLDYDLFFTMTAHPVLVVYDLFSVFTCRARSCS